MKENKNYIKIDKKTALGNLAISSIIKAMPKITRVQCHRILHYAYWRIKNGKDKFFYSEKRKIENDIRKKVFSINGEFDN